ncbi:DUF2817 domain-containing protein [Heyndrickxia sporothermodurans]|uniref:M14 family zinc carboxypeptidase n=1 Tax=Heyndrickxia sporothermodurans TaxID=46224 RepID=UPI002E1AE1FF|nr:M14 family zinc carboxypeptidase [Heyndrickxia sporothermodurans]MED3655574.1 DUF2817 domain-containing protein [Heyndrickxia sporothermodurans]
MRKFKLFFILIITIFALQINPVPSIDGTKIIIPNDFSGELKYENYSSLEERIYKFDNVSIIGKDQSGIYNMYCIELGEKEKPTILVEAGIHGSEWQGTMYSMKFMEELRDGTFPDKAFRNKLLDHFHIVYIPVVNPWGYDRTIPMNLFSGRYNSTGTDLNRDFYKFTQAESRNVKTKMDEFKPFAFLDIHMMQSNFDASGGNNIAMGYGQTQTKQVFDSFAKLLSQYSGQSITKWRAPPYENPINTGLARTYMRNQTNPYTPYTLSYIIELAKPVKRTTGLDAPLSDSQIMKYGMAGMYLFFYTSIMYFEEYNNNIK